MRSTADPRIGLRSRPADPTSPASGRPTTGGGGLALLALLLVTTAGCAGDVGGSEILSSGYVEATEVRLSTKIAGTLEEFDLQEGDELERGDEVARIDTVDLELALRGTRAERDSAAAELALLRAGPREEEIAEAVAEVERAEAELEADQRDLERMTGLLESGSGTEKARDDALARRDVAAARLEVAEQRLRRLRNGSRQEEIDAAEARLEAARARIAQLEQKIDDATVLSPATGIVTAKLVEEGELLTSGTGLAVISRLAEPWLTVYVPEPDLGRIRIGQEAEVITDGGERRTGRILYISPRAEFTPKNVQTRDERVRLVYEVRIGVDNEDGLFKPGMPAEARIVPVTGAAGPGARS